MSTTLVLGGARSGKSAYAQALAEDRARAGERPPIMIATAEAGDAEMAARIAHHRADRGEAWRTIETPLDLVAAIRSLAASDVAVVDCLTLWLSNLMHHRRDIAAETIALLQAMEGQAADIIFVSNEVGLGIVPDNALARRFRDEAGRLNQQVAAAAGSVVFVAAGLPLVLKPTA